MAKPHRGQASKERCESQGWVVGFTASPAQVVIVMAMAEAIALAIKAIVATVAHTCTYPSHIPAHTPVHRFWCPFSDGALHIPCGFAAHTLGRLHIPPRTYLHIPTVLLHIPFPNFQRSEQHRRPQVQQDSVRGGWRGVCAGYVRGYVRVCASPIPGMSLSESPSRRLQISFWSSQKVSGGFSIFVKFRICAGMCGTCTGYVRGYVRVCAGMCGYVRGMCEVCVLVTAFNFRALNFRALNFRVLGILY